MPTNSADKLEAVGAQIARDIETQRDFEAFLNYKRHWLTAFFTLGPAMLPGILVIVASEMSLPARAVVALAVAMVFGLVIEHFRLERRLNAAIQLLLVLSRKR